MQKFMTKKVREMEIDDAVEGFFLMKNPALKTTQTGKNLLSFKLADASGEIEAVFWDYDGNLHETGAGKPVKIRGTISDYNGKKQLTVQQIRLAKEGDPVDLNTLVPSAPIDPKQTYTMMVNLIESIRDPEYKNICVEMLARNRDMICCMPAAKSVHHAFRYGLLMHTYFMMCHADHMACFYPFVDRDLLLTGTFCHDLAKAKEFSLSPAGLVTDYSVPGHLLGHLYMGAADIGNVCREIGVSEEKSMLLQHMLLSHHGKPEFGAAVAPKTAEAMLLSMIDDLDAKMETIRETLDGRPVGLTDSVWALGYRLYNHGATISAEQSQN